MRIIQSRRCRKRLRSVQLACRFNIQTGVLLAYLVNWDPSSTLRIQASSDLPLLVSIKNLSIRLLNSLLPNASSVAFSTDPPPDILRDHANDFRVGFITPPFKDVKIPVTDHLHAHAFIGTSDLAGWWRGIAYSPIAWYDINDLIAEIR